MKPIEDATRRAPQPPIEDDARRCPFCGAKQVVKLSGQRVLCTACRKEKIGEHRAFWLTD